MNRRQSLAFGAVAAVAAAAGTGVAVWRQPNGGAPLPANFWQLKFARTDGADLAMLEFQGRPLLINFWATWCAPCVRELPAVATFAREQAARGGVQVLALAVDGATPVRSFLKANGLELPVALAGLEGSDLSRQLGNAQGGLPFTVLLNASGQVVKTRLGETNSAELDQWAASL